MRKLIYFVGATIDGYIAGPDGRFDFFPLGDDLARYLAVTYPETLPSHVRAELGIDAGSTRFDTVLMGRRTYQPALDAGITSPYRHLRQYVVSRTRTETADPEVALVPGDPADLVRELKAEEGLDVWLCGGGELAGSLLPEIDELIVKRYPIAIGSGVPLFVAPFRPYPFTLTLTRTFDSGAAVQTYARVTRSGGSAGSRSI
jgi:dihydrofolate reductase